MKTFSPLKNKVFLYPIYVIVAIVLLIVSCCTLNFLLVPPQLASTIEIIMADVESQNEQIDIVFTGSSRTYKGIDSAGLSSSLDKNVFNIAYEAANYFSTYYLLNELMKTQQPQTLFLEVSISNFTRESTTQDMHIYRLLTGENQEEFAKGISLDYLDFKYLDFTNYMDNFSNNRFITNVYQKLTKFDSIGDRITSYIDTLGTTYGGNGFIYAYESMSEDEELLLPKSYYHNGKLWNDELASEVQYEYFEKIIKLCETNNIEVILYSPPYPYSVTAKNAEDFELFDNYINTICTNFNLQYLNFSKIKKDIMKLENPYYVDSNHLNGMGATTLQPIIKEIITQIEESTFNQSEWFYESYSDMIQDYSLI